MERIQFALIGDYLLKTKRYLKSQKNQHKNKIMKAKYLSVLFIFLIFSSFRFQQTKLATGWYFVTENKQIGITFEDLDSHENLTVEKFPILSIGDIKSVKLVAENMLGSKIIKLKLKLTHDGNRKWNLATDEMSQKNKTAIFVFENKVLHSLKVIGKADYISPSIVDNDLNSSQLKDVYDSMPENIKQ